MSKRPLYFDYAATTPVDERVIKVMVECLGFSGNFGNPASSSHTYGQQARQSVEQARRLVGELVGATPEQIVWTCGATESNNLALKGVAQARGVAGGHLITSQIEHKAILDTARQLQGSGVIPQGMEVVFPYDTTPVVTESIKGVVETLVEAIVLVFLVMFLFLQNFRATVITTMTVLVVLLGTFGILAAAGFSINTLTMFGMVLAIGLLVDDAIVVVENVERVMSEEGLSPKEATKKSMGQIQGALVGIALVLSAVVLPMAFFSGSTGVIYKQFSITIVSAMALSVLVALIFTLRCAPPCSSRFRKASTARPSAASSAGSTVTLTVAYAAMNAAWATC
jgi:hypothetical protein